MNPKITINRWGVAASLLPLALGAATTAHAQAVPGGTLDPLTVPKYVTPLVIPPVLFDDQGGTAPLSVSVELREITQQVLPPPLPVTPLWAYGDPARPQTFNNPAFTFEVTKDTPTVVKWINGLAGKTHIIKDQEGTGDPVIDQTLHWAAPNGADICDAGLVSDCRGTNNGAELPYLGPVPMVTHVHGAHVEPDSDGYPEAWWLPAGSDPTAYATAGTFFSDSTYRDLDPTNDTPPDAGYAIFEYRNDQPSTTLWYHDHSLGITRLNVYAAGAGFWLIRDANNPNDPGNADSESGLLSGVLPGPAPRSGENPNCSDTAVDPTCVRDSIREIPIAIQPKSFNANGTQFYPTNRAFFEGLGDGQVFSANDPTNPNPPGTPVAIPFMPNLDPGVPVSDISPVWNPEAFFNTMVVNGNTWPELAVAQAQYRFRLLNASDSRFLNLSLFTLKPNGRKDDEVPFFQIGAEQSLLPNVVQIETGFATPLVPGQAPPKNPSQKVKGTFKEQALVMGPAERADVIVDFSGLPDGTIVRMFNTAPDAPFGGFPDVPADPATTGQVMQFVVTAALNGQSPTDPVGATPATSPYDLVLDANPGGDPKITAQGIVRDLALLEEESAFLCVNIDAKTGAITLVPGNPAGSNLPPLCPQGGVPFAPKAAVLGINGSLGAAGATVTLWDDPIATNPQDGAVETWELYNQSADAHPIHLHLVKFEVINRQVIGGAIRPPEPWEAGWKDTVIAYPGEITRVRAEFDIPGLYVWHCHILSHEDNEMMVPYCVGQAGTDCPADLFN